MTRDLLHLATGRRAYHHTTTPLEPDSLRILGSKHDCLRFLKYLKKYEGMETTILDVWNYRMKCANRACAGKGTVCGIKTEVLRKGSSPFSILVAYPDTIDELSIYHHVRGEWHLIYCEWELMLLRPI